MWCNFFCSCNLRSIFFYQIFYRLNADSFALGGEKQRIFMACNWCDAFPYRQIIPQSRFYFLTKINNHFISAFSDNFNSIIFKIYIIQIQSHAFRYTNSSSK